MTDKSVTLVSASWCGSCKAMASWFTNLSLPGIDLKYADITDPEVAGENITSVPVILFREGGATVQAISGAMGKAEFIGKVRSIWPEV
jgi:thiol-disulfide isomerase/thioredoxin